MTVRAKFKVNSVTSRLHWDQSQPGKKLFDVDLSPVSGGSEENKKFYEASPGGQIKLSTINEAAASFFPLGGEVYVDFSLATQPEPQAA